MLALGPDRAPIAAILKLQSSPPSSPPALPPVSVVPQALSARPATAVNATACHVLVERIMDPSIVQYGLSTSAASCGEPNTLNVGWDTIEPPESRAVAVS